MKLFRSTKPGAGILGEPLIMSPSELNVHRPLQMLEFKKLVKANGFGPKGIHSYGGTTISGRKYGQDVPLVLCGDCDTCLSWNYHSNVVHIQHGSNHQYYYWSKKLNKWVSKLTLQESGEEPDDGRDWYKVDTGETTANIRLSSAELNFLKKIKGELKITVTYQHE